MGEVEGVDEDVDEAVLGLPVSAGKGFSPGLKSKVVFARKAIWLLRVNVSFWSEVRVTACNFIARKTYRIDNPNHTFQTSTWGRTVEEQRLGIINSNMV